MHEAMVEVSLSDMVMAKSSALAIVKQSECFRSFSSPFSAILHRREDKSLSL